MNLSYGNGRKSGTRALRDLSDISGKSWYPGKRALTSSRKRVGSKFPIVISLFAVVCLAFVVARVSSAGSRTVASATPLVHLSGSSVNAAVQGCQPSKAGSGHYKVGIQAGHYQMDQLPAELSGLTYELGGSVNGVNEVDVNLDIAQRTVSLLKSQGVDAELLPSTVPENYCANAFVAVHADGLDDTTVSGYKTAPSFWDTDGKAQTLSDDIYKEFGKDTSMSANTMITEDMAQYYAFNFNKFTHTVDPNTNSIIIEVGFLTNDQDRYMMVNNSQEMAQGISDGVMDFLR